MDGIFPALLAFIIAAFITGAELVTSTYPRTLFLFSRCGKFYTYVSFYGIIAFIVVMLLDVLVKEQRVSLEGIGLENPWGQAIAVGVAIKAFMQINLFNVTVGTQTTPVGIVTITNFVTVWLLREIELYHFNAIRDFLEPYVKKYTALEDVKKMVADNFPHSFESNERAAILADVDAKKNVMNVMELYLEVMGKSSFKRVFSL